MPDRIYVEAPASQDVPEFNTLTSKQIASEYDLLRCVIAIGKADQESPGLSLVFQGLA